MKRENILITEDYKTKKVAAVKFVAPGDVPAFDCSIHFGEEGNDVTMQNCIIENDTIVKCSPDDTYDFEEGALIALMKMCGVEKVKKAAKETFFDVAENSVNEYEEKIHALEKEIKGFKGDIDELFKDNKYWKSEVARLSFENHRLEEKVESLNNSCDKYFKEVESLVIKKNELIEENEKLKLDCEKLQHGYIDTDMIFCGGRQNGKQYTFLTNLFKKMPKDKVDAAYKEAYDKWTELHRTLDINGTIYRKS